VPAKLEAAGYLAPADRDYLADVRGTMARADLAHEFVYHGAVDLAHKTEFLQQIDVMSMPATYDEPKGLSLLEAMAHGVPVVQPRRGAFTEIIERTGGGLFVTPDDPDSLAEALASLCRDRAHATELGRRAHAGVRAHYTIRSSAERLMAVYASL
jgi:glycosyltransferase involved in cell wall biosynthesis